MAEEDDSSKTEDPTERKLSKAREEEGQVPMSQEVKSWIMLFGVVMIVWTMMPYMMKQTKDYTARFITSPHAIPVDQNALRVLFAQVFMDMFKILMIPMGMLMVLAVISVVMQVGFLWTGKKLAPKWEKLNIFMSLKNYITLEKIIETLKGLLKIGAVFMASSLVVLPKLKSIPLMIDMSMGGILGQLKDIVLLFVFTVFLVMMIIAGADYLFVWFRHRKKMRMTKQEVKDEYKQSEGDPLVKSRIRSVRMERFRKRMMQEVPKSTVVITNPTHFAIALKYDMEEMPAPIVVAKGVDHLAQRIKEIANENEVPIVENPPLARALYASVEIDQAIPEEHFKAVAEVISYVMRLKKTI
ncbi:MAG: flagellar biosynthesis protein FlhB [Alphaproteobacteria bacterium]